MTRLPPAGLIFDKDGTLFDFDLTWGQWTRHMLTAEIPDDPQRRAALAVALGYRLDDGTFTPDSVVIAETIDVLADHMLPFLPGVQKPELMTRINAASIAVPQVQVAPLGALFADLAGRGLRLGLATNDSESAAVAHLTGAGIGSHFTFVAGSDSGFGGKPAPGQLRAFCAQTGLDPSACAMIGDSLHDLTAGRALGMTTIGVLTGPARADSLASMADVILPSIAYLPDWLDSHLPE